jgi:hypothetical protein
MLSSLYALLVAALISLIACALGLLVLDFFSSLHVSFLEKAAFSFSLGCGGLAYGVLLLGLVGELNLWALLTWLLLASLVARRSILRVLQSLVKLPSAFLAMWKDLGGPKKVFLAAATVLLGATTLQALTPPWDYDGLMYHLQGPRLFLEASRVFSLPDVWGANGPSSLEMLFALAMKLGTDRAPKVLHLAFGVCLFAITFALGRRLLPRGGEWLACAVLLGVPILPVWSSLAYSDLAWAAFESLAMLAIVAWIQEEDRRWLVLGGVCMGLALGSKYLALGGLGVVGSYVLWRERKRGLRRALTEGGIFGLVAVAVGLPWYLKNWALTGNPVFPVYFGGAGWTSARLAALMTYLRSFGTGNSLLDYVLLPLNLYAQHARFATFEGTVEIPGLLFPFALASPLLGSRRSLYPLWVMVPLRFAAWAVGSQQTRFLLPIFPALSVLAAAGLLGLANRLRDPRARRILLVGLVGGVVAATLVYAGTYWEVVQPGGVLIGVETPDAFLSRMIPDYSALQFVKARLSGNDRVLMMWDGEGYYCVSRCLPDAEQSRWTLTVGVSPTISTVTESLREEGVTHLLFSVADAGFILQHDPTGSHRRALEFFLGVYRSQCTRPVFEGQGVVLYELTCG